MPTGLPACVAPNAWAASSITGMPRAFATFKMPVRSHGLPNRCVTTIAFVRSVSRAATVSGVTFPVRGSTSANTGIAP